MAPLVAGPLMDTLWAAVCGAVAHQCCDPGRLRCEMLGRFLGVCLR